MKVLTVKQPWAELICLGIKDVENRSWRCPKKFIGERVLIHAAKKSYDGPLDFDQIKAIDGFIYKKNVSREKVSILNPPEMWNTSAIIGSVEIVDCVTNHPSVWAVDEWYNWVLANPVLFDKPILDVMGKLSFWDFDLYQKNEE